MNQLQQYNEKVPQKNNPYLIQDQCHLCDGETFNVMLRRALYERYFYCQQQDITWAIDDLVNEEITQQTARFKQYLVLAEQEQYLKRQYKAQEFQGKIQILSEYYKFHRDVPRIFQKSTQKTLNKYYDRLRNYDYKIIKRTLKQEQGVSLTTQKSQQSFDDGSSIEIKSRYSSVLNDLDNSNNESIILKDMCKKIGKAFQKLPFKNDFKGVYYSGQKKFEQYLFNLKTHKHPTQQQNSKNSFKNVKEFKQTKTHYQLYPKSFSQLMKINMAVPQVQSRKSSIKRKQQEIQLRLNPNNLRQTLVSFKKPRSKNAKSIQKTTANQTISRQQRSRKLQKTQKNLSNQIQKNTGIFKPLSADLIALKSNTMLKTLNQIYKPNNSIHQKYNSDKNKKTPSQSKANLNFHKRCQSKLGQNQQKYANQGLSRKSSAKNSKHNSRDMHNLVDNILFLNKGETDRQKNKNNILNHLEATKQKQKSVQKNSSKKSLKRSVSTSKKSLLKSNANKVISTNPSIQNLLKGQGHSTQKIINIPIWEESLVQPGSLTQRRVERQSSKKILPQKNKQNYRQNILQRNNSKSKLQKPNLRSLSKQRKSSSNSNLHQVVKKQQSAQKIERLSRNSSKSNLKSNKKANEKHQNIDKNVNNNKNVDGQGKNIDKLLEKKLTLFQKH